MTNDTKKNQSVSELFRPDWYQCKQCCVMLTSSVRIWYWILIRHDEYYVPTDSLYSASLISFYPQFPKSNSKDMSIYSTVKHVAGNYSKHC